ncbi:MAG: hypothetical protein Q7J73_03305 [Dehalococcoidales bacterium]|nr:hypothetical protein [Dehalococcoidales bacterium]
MKKRLTLVLLGLLALSSAISAGCSSSSANSTQNEPTLRSKYLLNSTISVKPDHSTEGRRLAYYDVPFKITSAMKNPSVQGIISAIGGMGPYAAVYVLDDSSFKNWINRNEGVTILYSLGAEMVATMNVSITAPGTYHLVFYHIPVIIPGGALIDRPAKVGAHIKLQWYQ